MPSTSDTGRPARAGPFAARPYGLLGLVVSLFIMAAIVIGLTIATAAVGVGVLAARDGLNPVLERLVAFQGVLSTSRDVAEKTGIVVGIAAYVATIAAILVVAWYRGRARWAELVAWRPWELMRSLPLMLLLLAATLTWSLVAGAAIEHIYPAAKDWTPTPSGTPWIVGFLAMATLFAPVAEELLFRGWIYTSLRDVIGIRFGIGVTALLFALAHWESTHLYALAVFPVGLSLGYLRERSGSIAASITFHSLYNGIVAVLLFAGR